MNKPLKVSVLDVNNREEVEQVYYLYGENVIATCVRDKLKKEVEPDIIQKAVDEYYGKKELDLLTQEDIKRLERELDPQYFYEECLISEEDDVENRCYILKDGEKIVEFQIAQLKEEKDKKMLGNITVDRYIEPEYAKKSGEIIDSSGRLKNIAYSEALYESICKWFADSGVNYERICIDINMLSDIETYILSKGFIPYNRSNKNIFLDKYRDYPINRETLEKIYELYIKNMQRTSSKTFDEIISEIDEEIGNGLGESGSNQKRQQTIIKRKQGLARVFMKNKERKMFDLNSLIKDCLRYRVNGIDYDLLYRCSSMMFKNLKIKDYNFEKITKFSDIEDSKKIALEFFKSIDQELYEKAKAIVEGNSDIKLEIYKFNNNDNARPRDCCVITKNGKSTVHIPYEENIEDIYSLVHELSHTFDLDPNKDPSTRQMLGEVTPFCFEYMLDYYLIEHGVVDKNDVANRQKRRIVSSYNDGMNTFAKIELMQIKERKNIEEEDIINLQQRYKLVDEQVQIILNDVLHSPSNAHYRARYMTAQLICLRYMEQYDKNPRRSNKIIEGIF